MALVARAQRFAVVPDNSNGALAYDADGAGAGVAVIFAVLGLTTHLGAPGNDFVIAV